jgi:hypothetical protein
MASRNDVIKEMDFLSDRISTQVRTVAVALLAITWGLLIGRSDVAIGISHKMKNGLLIIGTIAVLCMFLDFLQYFFGYLNNQQLLSELEKEKKEEGQYNYLSCSYKLRSKLFWIKQIFLIVGVGWFVILVLLYLI